MKFGFNFGLTGGTVGSTALAYILYDMNITDVDGTDYLLNQGDSGANDAIVLNATQDGVGSILADGTTDIDTGFKPNIGQYSIEETITGELQDFGSNDFDTIGLTGNSVTETPITNGWNIVYGTGGVASSYFLRFDTVTNVDTGKTVQLTFTASNIINGLTFNYYFDGSTYALLPESHTLVDGVNIISVPSRLTSSNLFSVSTDGSYATEFDITDISVKELTTTTQRTEQRLLTHDGNKMGDINEDVTGFTPFPSGTNNTNTVIDNVFTMHNESADGLAGYPFCRVYMPYSAENNNNVYWYKLIIEVTSGTAFLRDMTGYPYPAWNEALEVGTHIKEFWGNVDGGGRNSIYFDGVNYPTFDATLTVEITKVSEENKYYIDGLEQAVTPALPNPDININLNDTAVIGYPDTIDSREADFKVYTTVRTAEEILADHNAWILATYDVLTDGSGDYLTDANGVYLYTT